MRSNFTKKIFPSELRFDLISGDWVIIAKKRGRRPGAFSLKKRKKETTPKKNCPFCNLKEKPITGLFNGEKIQKDFKNWSTIVIPNKYPALLPFENLMRKKEGRFYQKISGVGFCELVVTRDHSRHFPHFSVQQTKEVFDLYQERYMWLMKRKFVNYISIFHNHGKEAGATQSHPHSQIITTPLIDNDLRRALENSKAFFEKRKKCLYCELNQWERDSKKRLISENESFLALCPFASKSAFEVIISPKFHSSKFETITEEQKWQLSQIFNVVMRKLFILLNDPPYNFYLHSAPCDGEYPFYHWHWTILPKTSTPAGFELGTRMEICTLEPEISAQLLRNIRI